MATRALGCLDPQAFEWRAGKKLPVMCMLHLRYPKETFIPGLKANRSDACVCVCVPLSLCLCLCVSVFVSLRLWVCVYVRRLC